MNLRKSIENYEDFLSSYISVLGFFSSIFEVMA